MTNPYFITVKSDGKHGIDVQIVPQPIASKKEFIPLVVKTIQHVIMKYSQGKNTAMRRAMMRQELEWAVSNLHAQGVIVPEQKEKDERDSVARLSTDSED